MVQKVEMRHVLRALAQKENVTASCDALEWNFFLTCITKPR